MPGFRHLGSHSGWRRLEVTVGITAGKIVQTLMLTRLTTLALTAPQPGLLLPQGADWAPAYQQIHRRARLHATQLPPDQLNPRGSYDAGLRPVFTRFTRPRKGRDERSGYLPLSLPPPGAICAKYEPVHGMLF